MGKFFKEATEDIYNSPNTKSTELGESQLKEQENLTKLLLNPNTTRDEYIKAGIKNERLNIKRGLEIPYWERLHENPLTTLFRRLNSLNKETDSKKAIRFGEAWDKVHGKHRVEDLFKKEAYAPLVGPIARKVGKKALTAARNKWDFAKNNPFLATGGAAGWVVDPGGEFTKHTGWKTKPNLFDDWVLLGLPITAQVTKDVDRNKKILSGEPYEDYKDRFMLNKPNVGWKEVNSGT